MVFTWRNLDSKGMPLSATIYTCLPPLKALGAATIIDKLRRINIEIQINSKKQLSQPLFALDLLARMLESIPRQTKEYTTAGSCAALERRKFQKVTLSNLFYLSLEVGQVSKDRDISLNQVIHRIVKPSSLLGLINPFQEDSSKILDLIKF